MNKTVHPYPLGADCYIETRTDGVTIPAQPDPVEGVCPTKRQPEAEMIVSVRKTLHFRTCPICGRIGPEADFRVRAYLDDKLVRICSLCASKASSNPYTGFFTLHG